MRTVKELREELAKYPDDMLVTVEARGERNVLDNSLYVSPMKAIMGDDYRLYELTYFMGVPYGEPVSDTFDTNATTVLVIG